MIDKDLEAEDKQREFKKLLYGLCFFHAVINERRKFGPIGWNKPYEFTFEDLEVCRRQLKVFLGMYEEIDYTVIKVICADINYGGRVTDKLDKRLISTIISSYICSEMLKDTYNMAEALPGDDTYLSPVAGTRSDYIQFIHSLPLNASPEVFGLHPNAAITTAQNENRDTLEILINIQPRSAGSAGSTREQIITESSKQIESKTPEVFDIEAVKKRYSPEDYNESMNTVLVQELIRYNGLLKLMKQRMIDV
jgi:dynein heavy chain